jgi:hypothetical protein
MPVAPCGLDPRRAGGADEPTFGIAQLPFGLVDGGHEVVPCGSHEGSGEIGYPCPIIADAVGDDGQFGGC